ncbi:hypothetical protein C6P41_001660 [Kluyveromyces marxianus]|nr:hypothetical protein C6P43_000441 [Kluyveromyces marxianus]KAG0676666.1 hypothetical protein C6P41_001660 [Kluyveromyces marxianus]
MSSLPNFLNLGTPQRKASDSRIERINKLFDAKFKDEASVVSNNSTSVVNDIFEPYDLHEEDATVKYRQASSRLPPSVDSVSSNEGFGDEINSRFMPKLRSKHSIVELSQHSTPKKSIAIYDNPIPKRRVLKEKLGEPLPLPYLDPKKPVDVGTDLETRWNTIISTAKVRQKKKPLLSNTKAVQVETAEPRLRSSSVPQRIRIPSKSAIESNREYTDLETQLKNTSVKLDKLIELLQNNQQVINNKYEPFIWLFCIIILILCNVWVYHYL